MELQQLTTEVREMLPQDHLYGTISFPCRPSCTPLMRSPCGMSFTERSVGRIGGDCMGISLANRKNRFQVGFACPVVILP